MITENGYPAALFCDLVIIKKSRPLKVEIFQAFRE